MKKVNIVLLVVITIAAISACSLPYQPAKLEPRNSSFYGIHPQSIGRKESTVIMIHGMCDHDLNWVKSNVSDVASGLGMNYGAIKNISEKNNGVEVYKAHLTGNKSEIINFYTIVYSSITREIKNEKLWKSDVKPLKKIFSPLEEGERKRGKLNRWIKGKMLNDCFADAVIYLGKAGASIREGVREAVDTIRTDAEIDAPIFLISESLGSKVLRDSLICVDENKGIEQERLVYLANTLQVFLFANQLPLLNEGNNSQCPAGEEYIGFNKNLRSTNGGIFDLLDALGEQKHLRSAFIRNLPIKVVSFTDPNDILSYEVSPKHFDDRGVVNIIVSNARTYFGLFSNPVSAHTSYMANEDVKKYLKCGNGENKKQVCN